MNHLLHTDIKTNIERVLSSHLPHKLWAVRLCEEQGASAKIWLCESANKPPPRLRHETLFCVAGGEGTCRPLPRKLNLDTYLTPQTKNWTDLNYRT